MSRFHALLVGIALAVGASDALAQRVKVEPKRIDVQPGALQRPGAGLLSPDALEKLKLTADQKDKYGKVETEYKDKSKTVQDDFRTALMNINDRTKFKEIQEKFQADTKKVREDALTKVEGFLTKDQKEVFAQVKNQQPNIGVRPVVQPVGGAGVGQLLPPGVQNRLQLTDEQKKQLETLQKEVDQKLMKILNDDQRKMLENLKKGGGVRPLPQPVPPRRIDPAQPNANPAPAVKRD